jgi:hypothetical protein
VIFNTVLFLSLFTFYAASVLYANWLGFRDGMEQALKLTKGEDDVATRT